MRELWALLIVAAVLIFAGTAQAAPVLWDSGTGANGHYYEVITYNGTWEQALAHAKSQPRPHAAAEIGYMASIESAEEQAFVMALPGFDAGSSWFGATDSDSHGTTEGTWVWLGVNDTITPFWW